MSVKKLSPQNGGFIRAKLARPRTFCAKANGNFEENPKWRIDMGKIFCQIGPLSRDRARILYLIILWVVVTTKTRIHCRRALYYVIYANGVLAYFITSFSGYQCLDQFPRSQY